MSLSDISASTQNYLKAVWSLQEWSTKPVTPTRIAAKAGVKLSTASDAVRKLSEQGLLQHTPYGAVTLTPIGREHAVAMVRRHRLIETFLVTVLGYRWDQIHDEAEHLEHAVSDFLVERIDQLLGYPSRDPHGDAIPTAGGKIDRSAAILLSALPLGAKARVERISDSDSALLQFFAEHGIGIGAVLEIQQSPPYSDTLNVAVSGQTGSLPLGRGATDAVWVSALPAES